ncbi:MAG: beta-ketoacyl-ACP synthase II [Planctomycetota bacterium]
MVARRRVVITGLGAVSPLGLNAADTWEGLLAGRSGVRTIDRFDVSDYPARIAGQVPEFDAASLMDGAAARKLDRFVVFGMIAAHEAMRDAGLADGVDESIAPRASVITGSGIGGLEEIEDQHKKLLEKGPRRVSPFLIPKLMLNALSGQVSMTFNLKGANFATASACASAGHAIALALRSIQYGESDLVVTGGSEAAITTLGMSGFGSLRALSTRNDDPQAASRPFDKDRDGFVMGEGAGILVVEELEHAKARGAKIYAELVGAGMTADAFHITQPAAGAEGAQRSMRAAMADGGLNAEDISYINAHGTSTPINDPNESQAIEAVLGDHARRIAVSSTKSMTGHLLGGSAAVEALVCALSIERGIVHQTLNHETPGEGCNLDYVKGAARDLQVEAALSNSLGFGGHNLTLAFRKFRG